MDALYTAPPDQPGAERIGEVEDVARLTGVNIGRVGSKVGTGGMVTKLSAAQLASTTGTAALMTSAQRFAADLGAAFAAEGWRVRTAGEAAAQADVVVTNHALLAIDAMADAPVLPEHDVVVVDEAYAEFSRFPERIALRLLEGRPRLVVSRSSRHVFVQVVDDTVGKTVASASIWSRMIEMRSSVWLMRGSSGWALACSRPSETSCSASCCWSEVTTPIWLWTSAAGSTSW